jgi:hypothetical protein
MDHDYRARVRPVLDLAAALRGHAAGIYAHRAAVELLVDHGVFLGRSVFREEFVGGVGRRSAGAYVRWAAAATALNQHRLPCSSSEAAILRIAASLGGDVPVRLGRVLGGLDAANIGRVTDAIALANGNQPHRCRRTVGE